MPSAADFALMGWLDNKSAARAASPLNRLEFCMVTVLSVRQNFGAIPALPRARVRGTLSQENEGVILRRELINDSCLFLDVAEMHRSARSEIHAIEE